MAGIGCDRHDCSFQRADKRGSPHSSCIEVAASRAILGRVRACSAARADNVFRAVPANRRELRLSVP
jgi:hypothetical protein